jgi:hypothetical protein
VVAGENLAIGFSRRHVAAFGGEQAKRRAAPEPDRERRIEVLYVVAADAMAPLPQLQADVSQ